jgi:hypothetical protein
MYIQVTSVNSKVIEVGREVARILFGYVKISEWRRKQYMKAKIKAEVKRVLMKRGFRNYSVINELSELIVEHATAMI